MAIPQQFRHEDVARMPRGYKIRTVTHPSGHRVRFAFPPGPRRKGAGTLVSVLHPKGERNPCGFSPQSAVRSRQLAGNARKAKELTREQVEKKQAKAVEFLKRIGQEDKAGEIGELSVAEYAEKKGISLTNPKGRSQKPEARSQKKSVAEKHQKRVQEMLAKMPKPIRDVFDRNPKRQAVRLNPYVTLYGKTTSQIGVFKTKHVDVEKGEATLLDGTKVKLGMGAEYGTHIFKTRAAAQKYADRENTPKAFRGNRKRRRNQSEAGAAAGMYKTFHGQSPKEVLEFQADIIRRGDYAALGDLIEITLPDLGMEVDFSTDDVILAMNASGTQLYAIGGNQDMTPLLGKVADATKDFIDLGRVGKVIYRARKDFDKFEEIDYVHKMGEGGKEKPRLFYDKLSKQLSFAGGEYRVKHEGIIH